MELERSAGKKKKEKPEGTGIEGWIEALGGEENVRLTLTIVATTFLRYKL